jgi:hypothetical protein
MSFRIAAPAEHHDLELATLDAKHLPMLERPSPAC